MSQFKMIDNSLRKIRISEESADLNLRVSLSQNFQRLAKCKPSQMPDFDHFSSTNPPNDQYFVRLFMLAMEIERLSIVQNYKESAVHDFKKQMQQLMIENRREVELMQQLLKNQKAETALSKKALKKTIEKLEKEKRRSISPAQLQSCRNSLSKNTSLVSGNVFSCSNCGNTTTIRPKSASKIFCQKNEHRIPKVNQTEVIHKGLLSNSHNYSSKDQTTQKLSVDLTDAQPNNNVLLAEIRSRVDAKLENLKKEEHSLRLLMAEIAKINDDLISVVSHQRESLKSLKCDIAMQRASFESKIHDLQIQLEKTRYNKLTMLRTQVSNQLSKDLELKNELSKIQNLFDDKVESRNHGKCNLSGDTTFGSSLDRQTKVNLGSSVHKKHLKETPIRVLTDAADAENEFAITTNISARSNFKSPTHKEASSIVKKLNALKSRYKIITESHFQK